MWRFFMRREKKKSIIWELGAHASKWIRIFCGRSKILQGMSKIWDHLTRRTEESIFFSLQSSNRRRIAPSPLYYHSLKAHEESLLLGFGRRTLRSFLSLSLNSVGFFLLLYGGFSILLALLQAHLGKSGDTVYLPFLTILSSVPLLPSRKSIYGALWSSRIGRWFMTDILGITQERQTDPTEHGKERPAGALLCAALASAIGLLLPFPSLLLIVLLLNLLCIFAFLPELLFLTILFLFPFFSMLRHSTLPLLGGMLLFFVLWLRKVFCGKRILHWGIVEGTVGLFAVGYAISAAFGSRSGMLFGLTSAFFVSSFFLAQSLFSRPIWRERAVIAMQCGGILCAMIGIWQAIGGKLELRWVDLNRFSSAPTRVVGTFSNPNFLALYLVFLLPIALAGMLNTSYSVRRRSFFAFSFFTEGICIVLTYTRGAWVGALISAFLFLLLADQKTNTALILSPIVWLPLIPFLPNQIRERFASIGMHADSSVRYRYATWKSTLRIIREHPFGIGIGADAFSAVYPYYAISGTETVMHAHQLGLQLLLELGIFGGVLFCALVFLFLCALTRECFVSEGKERFESLGPACSLIAVLIMGLFDHIWYHQGLFALFWIILALFFAPIAEKNTNWR